LDEGVADLDEGVADLDEGVADLDEGVDDLDEGEPFASIASREDFAGVLGRRRDM
jgi:X-X-X-Leu-X-X-Gly heptad repeat protein